MARFRIGSFTTERHTAGDLNVTQQTPLNSAGNSDYQLDTKPEQYRPAFRSNLAFRSTDIPASVDLKKVRSMIAAAIEKIENGPGDYVNEACHEATDYALDAFRKLAAALEGNGGDDEITIEWFSGKKIKIDVDQVASANAYVHPAHPNTINVNLDKKWTNELFVVKMVHEITHILHTEEEGTDWHADPGAIEARGEGVARATEIIAVSFLGLVDRTPESKELWDIITREGTSSEDGHKDVWRDIFKVILKNAKEDEYPWIVEFKRDQTVNLHRSPDEIGECIFEKNCPGPSTARLKEIGSIRAGISKDHQ